MNQTPKHHFYKRAPLSWVHLKIYLAIILGQFTCGYTIQISGSAISAAQKVMPVSSTWVGLIGAGTLIGLVGSLWIGKLSERVGRRRLLLLDMYLLILVSLAQLATTNLVVTFLLRVLAGLMMAVEYTAGNTLLIEWLPIKEGGRFQSRLIIYWVLGFIVASVTGDALGNWQLMMISPALPALVTAVFRSVAKLPTSPSWLVNQGQAQQAQKVIQKNLGRHWSLSKKQKEAGQTANEHFSWTLLFSRKYLRNTAVGGIFYGAQAFTFFGISIFLPILVAKMGIGNPDFVSYLYNGCMLLGVIIGTMIFNRLTRRQFLVAGFALSAACLLVIVFWRNLPNTVELTIFSLFSLILSAGLVIENPYMSELYDATVRGTGVGMVVMISRFGAAAGTFLLPVVTAQLGVNIAMLVCGLVLAFAGCFCFAFAPETRPHTH